MNRLDQLNLHFKPAALAQKRPPTTNVWESMGLDQHMRDFAVQKRKATAKMMAEAKDKLIPYVNSTDFPYFLIPKIRELGIDGGVIKGYGSPGFTNLEAGAIVYELARVDASVATFFSVHNAIGQNVVAVLGDEE